MAETLQQILAQMELLVQSPPSALVEESPKPNLPAKQPSASSVSVLPKLALIQDNPTHQNQLSDLLNQTYALLKKYGEAADTTEMRDAGFQMMLGDYDIETVTKAFRTYLKTNKEIPTPADIIEIIDPSVKPLDRAFYSELLKRRAKGEYLTSTEWAYVHRYEDEELTKV